MARVFTHQNVDLDAVMSVAAWLEFVDPTAEVVFVPANFDGVSMEEGDVALDLDAGGRGIKGDFDGTVIHSCLARIVREYCSENDKRALEPLVKFVNAQDAHGSAYKYYVPTMPRHVHRVLLHCGVNAVLRTFQAMNPQNDRMVVSLMCDVFRGLLAIGRGIELSSSMSLDHVASVWAWRRFVSATTPIAEILTRLTADRQGGVQHSCFTSLILRRDTETMQAISSLMSFVDAEVTSVEKDAFRHFLSDASDEAYTVIARCGLSAVLHGFELASKGDEEWFYARAFEIFEGMLKNGLGRRFAEEEAAEAEIIEGRIAVTRNARSIATTIILLDEYRYDAVVFVDRMNLGVVRRNDIAVRMDHPKIRALVAEEEEKWFFHKAGFMAAHGTRKSPAKTPSKIDPMALVRVVLEVLKDSRENAPSIDMSTDRSPEWDEPRDDRLSE